MGGYVGVVLWGGTVGWYGGVVCGVVRIMKSLILLNQKSSKTELHKALIDYMRLVLLDGFLKCKLKNLKPTTQEIIDLWTLICKQLNKHPFEDQTHSPRLGLILLRLIHSAPVPTFFTSKANSNNLTLWVLTIFRCFSPNIWKNKLEPNDLTNQFSTDAIQYSSLSLNSNVVLYNGGIKRTQIKQSDLEYELAQLTQLEGINNLSLNILAAYLQILLSEEQLEVIKQQAKLTDKQLEQSQKLVKVGVIPEGDLLDIASQIANEDLTIVNSQNAIASAYLNLAQTLDIVVL